MKKDKKTKLPEAPPGTALKTVVEEDQSMNKLLQLTISKLDGEGAQSAVMVIKDLVDLKNKQEDRAAKREFHTALAEFQEECPQIPKTKSTPGASSAGGKFGFAYAPLNVVEKTIGPHLYSKGFSYYWDGDTTMVGDKFLRKETCRLLHRNGHETSSSLSAPVTKEIGSMNDVQRFGAVQAYLKRYTLLAILGVPTADVDTDAVLASVSPETIGEKEIKVLRSKLKIKRADEKAFFKYMDVKDYAEIRKVDLSKAALALDMYEKKEKPPEKAAEKKEPEPLPKTESKLDFGHTVQDEAVSNVNNTAFKLKREEVLKAIGESKRVKKSEWIKLVSASRNTVDSLERILNNLKSAETEG